MKETKCIPIKRTKRPLCHKCPHNGMKSDACLSCIGCPEPNKYGHILPTRPGMVSTFYIDKNKGEEEEYSRYWADDIVPEYLEGRSDLQSPDEYEHNEETDLIRELSECKEKVDFFITLETYRTRNKAIALVDRIEEMGFTKYKIMENEMIKPEEAW